MAKKQQVEPQKRPRHTADWSGKPFAVIVGKSMVCKANCATREEALDFVSRLPLPLQLRAYVAEFKPVIVETSVKV